MKSCSRVCLLILLLACLLQFTGCIAAATPMIKRERGPNGDMLPRNSLDPSFIQVGVTRRDEITTKLSVIDTGCEEPKFFWGRWAASKWGYLVAAGGYGAAAGDAGRIWTVHNLLVTFDDNGVTTSMQGLGDGKLLWQEIRKQAAAKPPLEMTGVIFFPFDYVNSTRTMTFTAEAIEAKRTVGDKTVTASFSPRTVQRLSHSYAQESRNNPGNSCHVLHLSRKSPLGDSIPFCADGPDVFAVFRYLQRYGPPDMKWE